MKNKEILSVAEYARIKGISKQRVYQLLNTRLKEFVQEVDGQKFIAIQALSEEEQKALAQGLDSSFNGFEQGYSKDIQEQEKADRSEIERLQAEILQLQEDINGYKRQLELRENQLVDYALKFAELAEKNAELVAQAHLLHMSSQKQLQAKSDAEPGQEQAESCTQSQKKSFWT